MGNRAVITTKENFENNGVGVYLHWNGGRDSVESFLTYCDMKNYRPPESDNYGWARLCQVIGNFFGGNTSIGIDTIDHLDCDNWDNGVYLIENWKIVGRRYFDGMEQTEYDKNEMLEAIDEAQPKNEQFGKAFFKAKIVSRDRLRVGDVIYFDNWNGEFEKRRIVGIGEDRIVNGSNVLGIPYVDRFNSDTPETNPNNYLHHEEYRVAKSAER